MGFDLLRKEVDSVEERTKRDRKEKVGCLRHCMFVIPRSTHVTVWSKVIAPKVCTVCT